MNNKFMHRCIELASLGIGNVSSNPMVGSVIVHENKIIGEGFHQKYGNSHAEVNAIKSVKNKDLLKSAKIFVNLEPCSHYGKTPPCADLIIQMKIPTVIIGCVDSFSEVSGRGIAKLKAAGCKVIVGVLEKECLELNRRFFTYHNKKRPFIILKWAQSIDGYIDIIRTKDTLAQPVWITNKLSRTLTHKWRAEEDAIIVGTNTAQNDNPKLNIRDWQGTNPIRIVLDKTLRLSTKLSIFDTSIPTIIFTEKHKKNIKNLEYITVDFSNNLIAIILNILYNRKIQSLIIEGGTQLLNSFIQEGLWDEARIFTGNKYFHNGTKAPKLNSLQVSQEIFRDNILRYFYNKQ